jgi:DNA invertase Pin-like site-specific DNA recombinase
MQIDSFKKFGRISNSTPKERHKNAVIYTRVSTAEQVNNFSLETQLQKCQECAVRNGLIVRENFGGTSGSGTTDKRIEFIAMLAYAKNPKHKIGYVIVYSLDRFSRTGIEAVIKCEELKKIGIKVMEANTISLEDNIGQETMDGMKLIWANTENKLRTQKIIDGTLKRLESGYWCGLPPKGYYKKDKLNLGFTEDAKFIKLAFEMKADGYTNSDILRKVKAMGSTITKSRLPRYLLDPFYCGIIANKHLNGRCVQGKHEPLISEELFLKVNNSAPIERNYKTSKTNEERPLQGDLKCACGGVFTGYIKKGRHNYYKCNKCQHNTSVKPIHDSFELLLSQYSFDAKYLDLFKKQLKYTFDYIEHDNVTKKAELLSKISKNETKLKHIEMKYAISELEKDVYYNVTSAIKDDVAILSEELNNITFNLSNYSNYINESLEMVNKIGGLWKNYNVEIKKEIQNVLFSNHVEYNAVTKTYRTPYENSVMTMLVVGKRKIKVGKMGENPSKSHLVLEAGIEP